MVINQSELLKFLEKMECNILVVTVKKILAIEKGKEGARSDLMMRLTQQVVSVIFILF